jgi:hypothetical protein
MSARLNICGFDLAKCRSLFGSGDEHVIESIRAEFDRLASSDPASFDTGFCSTFHAALRQAIHQGIPFPGLAEEQGPHVQLAILLAGFNQELLGTDSDYWGFIAFGEALETGSFFTPDPRDLVADADFFKDLGFSEFGEFEEPFAGEERENGFTCIEFGRPLFGERFASHNIFGYLSHDELRNLRSRLKEADDEDADIGSKLAVEFVSDFTRWCDQLLAANKDLCCTWA